MRIYLIPYEQTYLNVTMNLDEATELADTLEMLRSFSKNKLLPTAEKFQQLLSGGIEQAAAYQQRKGTI